jgi:drug/metabolite transporter (DMT)-like permease
LQRRQTSPTHPFVSAAVQQLAAGIVYAPLALFQVRQADWNERAIIATLYLAVFGGIIGYSSYVFAMNKLPVPVASLYTYINPLVAVWLGWLFYREPFSRREAVGMAIIFAGVWLVKRAHRMARPGK